MKKLILATAVVFAIGSFNSCSSRDDEPTAPTEKQDFTNSTYIKNTMLGTWNMTHANYSGSWSSVTALPGTTQYVSNYKFNSNNSYTYKPFTNPSDNSMNESGTYSITPATATVNAILKLTYSYNNQNRTREIILENYNNGVVEIAEQSIICPSGTCRERFQKQ